jgi:hypothetical protein
MATSPLSGHRAKHGHGRRAGAEGARIDEAPIFATASVGALGVTAYPTSNTLSTFVAVVVDDFDGDLARVGLVPVLASRGDAKTFSVPNTQRATYWSV